MGEHETTGPPIPQMYHVDPWEILGVIGAYHRQLTTEWNQHQITKDAVRRLSERVDALEAKLKAEEEEGG